MQFADPSILILRPLRMPGICAVVLLLALLCAGYCLLHGVVAEGSVDFAVSIAWGLSHALCWWPAWECLKRATALPRRASWVATILGVCLVALALNVACGYALWVLVSPEAHPRWTEIAYQRFPIACALAVAAIVLHASRARATARERLQDAMPAFAHDTPARIRDAGAADRASPQSVERWVELPLDLPPDESLDESLTRASMPVPMPAAPSVESATSRPTSPQTSSPGQCPASRPPQTPTMLRLPTRHGVERVCAAQIDTIKAAANYVELFGCGRSWLLRATLHEMATRLDGDGFVRVHRSILVNRHRVASVARSGQRLLLTMRGGERVPVGRRYLQIAQALVPDPPERTAFVPNPRRSSPEL